MILCGYRAAAMPRCFHGGRSRWQQRKNSGNQKSNQSLEAAADELTLSS
jgi:hypothetical protein